MAIIRKKEDVKTIQEERNEKEDEEMLPVKAHVHHLHCVLLGAGCYHHDAAHYA